MKAFHPVKLWRNNGPTRWKIIVFYTTMVLVLSLITLHSQAAESIEDRMLAAALGSNWKSQWNESRTIRFTGTVSYTKDGGATCSFDSKDLSITPACAIVAWLEPGNTLQCCRYAFWLQSDGKRPSFFGRIFGAKDEKPKSNPGSPMPIRDDVASPQINIATDDAAGWPDGRPDRLTIAFSDNNKPLVYLSRGNGQLLAGDVQFAYASPQVIAQKVNDKLEPRERSKNIDGGTAGEVQSRGEFKHVHRTATSSLTPSAKIHFIIIEPKPHNE